MINASTARLISIISLSMALAGCGNDSSSGNGLSINITDAPVDSATKVVISFSGISIKPEAGPEFDIDFVDDSGNPAVKIIDLLSLQGSNSEPLLVNQTLDAGHYNWMRLKVITNQVTTDSFIELDDGSQHSLYVPSGNETGLKLNQGFDVTDGGAVTFTIDFDLRKSVLSPNNNSDAYKLKPTLRIVNNENMGHITGNVGSVSLADASCTESDYAVYLYTGEDITADDTGGSGAEPVSTSLLSDASNYTIGFLDAGSYTLAFTCQANDDDSETDDAIDFIGTTNITVTAGATTRYNFE
jgi:hypothetical protein